jgi:flagellar basal-body rod protein FlgG
MLNGLYSAAAGMAAQQERLDTLANDVANVNTTGYKSARLGFRDLVYNEQRTVRVGAGAALVGLGRNQMQGVLKPTEDPFALAIDGPGFFQVRRADGTIALTRDGNFRLDAAGAVVNSSGERLVPPITVPRGVDASEIGIGADGTVTAAGRRLGRIVVVDVTSPTGLFAAGGNALIPTAASGAPRAVDSPIRQGFLENSNVDFAESMVNVLDAQRTYEMNSRVIQTQDQLLEIANGIRR